MLHPDISAAAARHLVAERTRNAELAFHRRPRRGRKTRSR